MATKEQLAEWIVANEDKKGTPDFETVVAAYKELSVEEESISEKAKRLREEGEEELRLLQEQEIEEPEEEPDIFDQFEEFGKGIFGGVTGLLESSALGTVTPFGEDTETAAREGILSVSDPVRGFFAADKGSEEIFGRKFGEALGSFLGIGAAAIVPIVGLPLAAGLAVTAGAGEASERARAAGATEGERGTASFLGSLVGATELVSPLRIIKAFKKSVGDEVADGFFDKLKRITKEAGVEGGQEFTAAFFQNAIEKGIYNPEKGLLDDALEQGGYGAGVGGFVSAIGEMVAPKFRQRKLTDQRKLLITDQRDQKPDDELVNAIDAEQTLEETGKEALNKIGPRLQEGQEQGELFDQLGAELREEATKTPKIKEGQEQGELFDIEEKPKQGELLDVDEQLRKEVVGEEPKGSVLPKSKKDKKIKIEEQRKAGTDDVSLEKIDTTTARVGTETITQDVDRKRPDDVTKTPEGTTALGTTGLDDAQRDVSRVGRREGEQPDTLDVANDNMLQEDIDPKELQKAKIEIPKLIEKQRKEKKPDDDKVVNIKSKDGGAAPLVNNMRSYLQNLLTYSTTTKKPIGDILEGRPFDKNNLNEDGKKVTIPDKFTDKQATELIKYIYASPKTKQTITDTMAEDIVAAIKSRAPNLFSDATPVAPGPTADVVPIDKLTQDKVTPAAAAAVSDVTPVDTLTQDTKPTTVQDTTDTDVDKTVDKIAGILGKRTRKVKKKAEPKEEKAPLVKKKKAPEKITKEEAKTKQIYGAKAFAKLQKSPKKKRKEAEISKAIKDGVQKYDIVVEKDAKTGKTKEVKVNKKQVKTQTELFTEFVKDLRKEHTDYDARIETDLSKDENVFEDSDLEKLAGIMEKGKGIQQSKESLDVKAGRAFNKYAENVSRTSDVFVLVAHDSIFNEGYYKTQNMPSPQLKEYFKNTGQNRANEIIEWSQKNLSEKANNVLKKLIAVERSDYIKQREARHNAASGKWGETNIDKKLKAKQKAEADQFNDLKRSVKAEEQSLDDYMATAEEISDSISNDDIIKLAESEYIKVDKYLKADATEALVLPLHPSIKNSLKAGDLKLALQGLAATSTKEIQNTANKLADKVGTTKVKIVKNLADAAGMPVSGLFDPKTNTISLDADTGFNPHVILHEMAHAVTSANLANKSHPTTKQLTELFNNVKDMLDTAYGSTNVDEFVAEAMSNPAFQAKLADLHPNGKPINAFQRLVNIVGNFIRRIVGAPTKNIESALSRVDEVVDEIITPAPEFRTAGQLALMTQRPELLKNVKKILSSTANVLDKNQYTSAVYDFITSKAGNLAKRGLFISLPLQSLGDLSAKFKFKSPRVRQLQKTIEEMLGDTGQVDVSIDAAIRKFEPFFKVAEKDGRKDAFDFVVYQSTVHRVDPTKKRDDYKNKDGTPKLDDSGNSLLAKYDEIQKEWNKLGQEGQAVYNDMRRTYAKQYNQLKDVILGKIDESDASTEVKASLKKEVLAKLFDKNKIEPYFPLTREGDYWLAYKVKKGDSTEMAYEAFETNQARKRAMEELKNDPDVSDIDTYSTLSKVSFQNAPSGSFVKDVLQVMKTNKINEETQEQVLRMFIETLPATSFAKSFVKRKNSPGYKEDALGAFKEKGYDIGRQVVRMKYGQKLREIEDGLAEDFKAQGSPEEATLYVEELQKRAAFARTPPRDFYMRAASTANRIAFLGTIGFNFSSAVVNATQIPLMFQPILGGKYGQKEAMKAIHKAGSFVMTSGFGKNARKITTPNGEVVDVGAAPSIDNFYIADGKGKFKLRDDINVSADKLRELNRLLPLVQMASDRGQLNRSLFYDTLTLEEGGRARNIWDKLNAFSAFFFHQQEKMNRQVALISTYNLELNRLENNPTAKERNLSLAEKQELAANEALYRTQEMNGGAALANAPRIAQIPLGRVAMMYKSYGIQMYYTLLKTGAKAIGLDKSLSPQEKRIAQKQFAGIAVSSALIAGVAGMPFVGAAMFIANMLFFDDEEESAEFMMNRWLGDTLYKGPISAYVTDISGRVGLSNLIFRNNPYNKDDSMIETIGKTVGGPAGSVVGQFISGLQEVTDEFGDTQRGLERMLPAAFRNVAKTGRYIFDDGIYTRRGDPIIDDVSGSGLFFQFFGFPPSEYTRAQEQNQVAKGIDKAVNIKRSKLLRQLYLEIRHGMDTSDAMEAIQKFNARHPRFAISYSSIRRSIKQHIRQSAKMHNGVSISPKMRQYMRDQEDLYLDLD